MEEITSRKNPLIARIRRLAASREERREQGLFLGDGVKLLEEAVRWGAALEAVVLTRGVVLPDLPDGVRTAVVPQGVMESLSSMRAPQGALFLCRQPSLNPPEKLEGKRYLVLDGLQDPGNVGTIWRTADALGADGVLLTGGCADPYSPKTVRATMGACFRLPVWECTAEELETLLERSGLPLYGAALEEGARDLREAAGLGRCAVAIGNEGSGISRSVLQMSAGTLKIPMRPRCESLNAAAAAAVVLWELARETI